MKILIIVDDLATTGGTQKTTLMTYWGLKRLGHNVTVLTSIFDNKTCYPGLSKGIKTISLINNERNFLIGIAKSSSSMAIFIRVILMALLIRFNFERFDAVLVEDEITLLVPAFIRKGKQKFVWYLNNQLSGKMIKMLATQRKTLRDFLRRPLASMFVWGKCFITKLSLSKIDYLATYDSFNKNLLAKIGYKNTVIVSVGGDVRKVVVKRSKIFEKRRLKILSMGVIFPYRRYEDIIRATKMVEKEKIVESLTIVGLPDFSLKYYKYLISLTKKLNIQDKVNFISYVTEDEKLKLFKNSDLFVFVNDANTWGLVVVEAISDSLPVVISDNIGIAEILDDRAAYIVRPKSPSLIASVLRTAYSHPDTLRIKASMAYKKVVKSVSWKNYVLRIEKLLISK
jgi:glycosyltransferase involved in cell wall biosynthesis